VFILIMLILTWNAILDTRNFPKEGFHNWYIHSESFMSEKFMFCSTGKKQDLIPESLQDLCYRE